MSKKRKKNRKKKLTKKKNKIVAVTLGDPEGIGPEIIHKSLQHYQPRGTVLIIGNGHYYPDKKVTRILHPGEAEQRGVYFYDVGDRIDRETSFQYVKTGVELALSQQVAALVTAPVSKEKWLKAGVTYKGHTEYLAETAGVNDYSMFFWSENMKVSLFTIHIPLKNIFKFIKKGEITRFIRSLDRELYRLFKQKFTFLVSGLNPHAGEDGFLGSEEIAEIIPAIAALRQEGETGPEREIKIEGPFPPDIVFLKAGKRKDAVVVSWYHDQGLIPFKLFNIHTGVNMTLGLPYIRTSPDHGTAYDIAGKNMANPSSMTAAIKLAEKLVLRQA